MTAAKTLLAKPWIWSFAGAFAVWLATIIFTGGVGAGAMITAALSLAVAVYMKGRLDDLASIVNFGALSGFLFLHISVLAYFGIRRRSSAWIRHWLVPMCGIIVVLAVFSGMSTLAAKVGSAWLAAGVVYGLVLKAKHRGELHVPL